MPPVCGKCVLLVDDDPSLRDLLSRQLGKMGFEAILAEDGIDALAKLRYTVPKVIIADLQMPRMSGLEFIAVVRRRFPAIPVIAISGLIDGIGSAEVKPDRWFEKNPRLFPELMQAVNDLAQKTPDHVQVRQVISTPIRTPASTAGDIVLTCAECLRPFALTPMPENGKEVATAICVHCQAYVPFQIDSSGPR